MGPTAPLLQLNFEIVTRGSLSIVYVKLLLLEENEGWVDKADPDDRLQVWRNWEDLVHQAGRGSLLLWGWLLRRLGFDLGFGLGST
jgi:hypothetical protein